MTTAAGAPAKTRHRISQRQKRWLLAYLTTAKLNATEAARTAEYRWPNHSGPENLRKLEPLIDFALEHSELWREPPGVIERLVDTLTAKPAPKTR